MKVTGTPAAAQAPPMKQPTDPAPRIATLGPPAIISAPSAIGLHALVGQPEFFRRRARLPEHVDRHPATRVPVAADAQPLRLHLVEQALPDADGHVFVETAMIAE